MRRADATPSQRGGSGSYWSRYPRQGETAEAPDIMRKRPLRSISDRTSATSVWLRGDGGGSHQFRATRTTYPIPRPHTPGSRTPAVDASKYSQLTDVLSRSCVLELFLADPKLVSPCNEITLSVPFSSDTCATIGTMNQCRNRRNGGK